LEDIHHALYVMQLELEELEHAGIEKVDQLFLDILWRQDDSCRLAL
jgi:hypothetical protein